MIKSLYIKNYAIIDELNIDFSKGFNVFTGETGAGKSIIIGALSYLIKGKADPSVIKSGQEKAIIEGIFTIDEYMKNALNEAEIGFDDELIVRRIISNDGHNSIKINQTSVTLSFLSELLGDHIDIHSQKDSQYLLNKKNHLYLLDKYSNLNELKQDYDNSYNNYLIQLNEYNDLINNTYNESELDYLKYDLNELQEAKLDINEEIELNEKEKRYKSAEKYISTLSNCINIFDGDNSVKERLNLIIKELNLDDEDILEIKSNIQNLYFSLDDEISKLKDVLSTFSDDDFNIETIEERLYLYSRLKRKHGLDTRGLIDKLNSIKEKIEFFENKDVVINEKKKSLDKLYNECFEKAKNIQNVRIKHSTILEKEITKQCEDLMLNNVKFKVSLNETDLNKNGIDDVEFYISLNKGETLKPLKDVASGGEISRLMLALKTIFSSLSEMSLVIFDEIDSGVSGKVALAMGQKMASISKNIQVITISHLAPVAACANNHFYIYKEDDNKSTTTKVKQLKEHEIIEELAKISSADKSISSLLAATELYKTAQESVK